MHILQYLVFASVLYDGSIEFTVYILKHPHLYHFVSPCICHFTNPIADVCSAIAFVNTTQRDKFWSIRTPFKKFNNKLIRLIINALLKYIKVLVS